MFGNALGNAAIAGIEEANARSATKPAQASIEINPGSPQLQVSDIKVLPEPIGPVSYTVQGGDSLSGILGTSDPAAIGAFMRANGLTSSTIYPGEQLALPSGGYTASDEALGHATLSNDDAVSAAEANRAFNALGGEMAADTLPQAFNLFPNATYGMSPGELEASTNFGSGADNGKALIDSLPPFYVMNKIAAYGEAALAGVYAGGQAIPDKMDAMVAGVWGDIKSGWAHVSSWNALGSDVLSVDNEISQLPEQLPQLPGEVQNWATGLGNRVEQDGEQFLNYLRNTPGTQITYDTMHTLTSNAPMIALGVATDGLGEIGDGGELWGVAADSSAASTVPALDASTQKLVDELHYAYLSGGDTTTPARALAELSTNVSGDSLRVILGQNPGYATEAQTNGGIWFQTPDGVWPALTQDLSEAQGKDLGWLVNEQFLQTNLENGVSEFSLWNETPAEVLLNRKNSFTAREVNFLQDNAWRYGYRQQGSS